MRPERETRISGLFEGWNPNTIYRLVDGTKWKLARVRASQSSRNRPLVRVWRYDRRFYLEIVDIGEFAEVQQIL